MIELLVVLVILASAFAIALPAITSGTATELRVAARTVAAGLRQTRDRAINTHRAAAMEVDVERRRITLSERFRSLPPQARVRLFTARSERIDDTRGTIRFFPDGSSTGGRVMLATDHRSLLIDVDWLTGRVTIIEGRPEDWALPTAFEPVRLE